MARLARVVIPHLPHHVTQRGNGRQQVFFSDADYAAYAALLSECCRKAEVAIWAWCLMPNHVHLVLVPSDADGLRRALAPLHRRYAGLIHAREKKTGHFWQGRFGCVAMDEAHLAAALRYVSLNPVRAHLVAEASDWRWSSAKAHLSDQDDGVTARAPALERYGDFREFLSGEIDLTTFERLRRAEATGRPIGDSTFMARLESATERSFAPAKRGRKARASEQ
jgi:putative transposase